MCKKIAYHIRYLMAILFYRDFIYTTCHKCGVFSMKAVRWQYGENGAEKKQMYCLDCGVKTDCWSKGK